MNKQILIHMPSFANGRLFDPRARDGCLEPFIRLRDRLGQLGYELNTSDDYPVDPCEWILFWDVPEQLWSLNRPHGLRARLGDMKRRLLGGPPRPIARDLYAEAVQAGLQDRMAVFLSEPAVVIPDNWVPAVHERFRIMLTWRDDFIDSRKTFKYHEPIPVCFPDVPDPPFGARKLLVNISGNKRSSQPHELYSARRQAIRHFERTQPEQFDLYGTGWDGPDHEPPFSSYRGSVQHKWHVYPKYRFGLCYENSGNEPGLVSEKIFDCMRANSVPVYWGAPNISEYVDPEAFIDRRLFAGEADLERFLVDVSERQYSRYREAIREYLRTPRFAQFLSPAFVDTVVMRLNLG